MKKIFYFLGAGLILATMSCSSPAEKAEKKADEAANTAVDQATAAADQQAAADVNAANAVTNAVIANADELMSKVPMPTLSGEEAKIYAKKIGNHIVDYVNAKDASKADSYASKVKDEYAKVDELTAKGKISADDSKAIKDYGANLLKAVGIQVK
jgi:hypothetical protein